VTSEPAVAENVALLDPLATTADAGIVRAVLSLVNGMTVALVAAFVSVTVHVVVAPDPSV
jgi:hypothetical protein